MAHSGAECLSDYSRAAITRQMERILQQLISIPRKLLLLLCWLMSVIFHAVWGRKQQNTPGNGLQHRSHRQWGGYVSLLGRLI